MYVRVDGTPIVVSPLPTLHTQDDGGPHTTNTTNTTNTPRKQHQHHHHQQLRVTPLGYHLAALPCPVRLGKMLVYGAVLGVLGPTLRYGADGWRLLDWIMCHSLLS